MASHLPLDLKLIAANGLEHITFKMDCCAEATMSGDRGSLQKTPTDRVGGCHPTWNCPLKFIIPVSATDLVVEVVILCENGYGGKLVVGRVSISVKDLLIDAACTPSDPSGCRFLSYPVIREYREPMGRLHFSYKFSNPSSAPPLQQVAQQYGSPSPPLTLYARPPVSQQNGIPSPPIICNPPHQMPQQYGIHPPTVTAYPPLVPQQSGMPSDSFTCYPHQPSPQYGMTASSSLTSNPCPPAPPQTYNMASPPATAYPPSWVMPQYGIPSPASSVYPPRPVAPAYMESQSIQPLVAYTQQPPPLTAVAASNGAPPTVAYPTAYASVVRPGYGGPPSPLPAEYGFPPGPRPAIQAYAGHPTVAQLPPRNGILGGIVLVNALCSLPGNVSSAFENLIGDGTGGLSFFDLSG